MRPSNELYHRCRDTLLKCSEFDSNASLRAVFVTDALSPFRSGLPEATSGSKRVDATLDYLLSQRLNDGRPVFPLFLEALRDRYQEGDALRDELEELRAVFSDLSSTAAIYRIAKQRRFFTQLGRLKIAILLLGLLLVSSAGSLFCVWSVTWLTRDDNRIYNVQVGGQSDNILIAYNQKGDPIWQEDLDSKIRKAVVEDINQDGRTEVIVATCEPGERPGWLLVLDAAGRVIGEYNTWKPTIYFGGASEQFNIADFLVTDLTGDGTKEIVVISKDVYWYASRLAVFRFQGDKFYEVSGYWNPGLLKVLKNADVNGDGIQEIICIGENNDLQAAYSFEGNVFVVIAFEGNRMTGQAPPLFGDAPPGTELWYAFAYPLTEPVTEVEFADANRDGTQEFHITLTANCSWYLDLEGNVVSRGMGSGCTGEENELVVIQADK
jgi:hypothetical protein